MEGFGLNRGAGDEAQSSMARSRGWGAQFVEATNFPVTAIFKFVSASIKVILDSIFFWHLQLSAQGQNFHSTLNSESFANVGAILYFYLSAHPIRKGCAGGCERKSNIFR